MIRTGSINTAPEVLYGTGGEKYAEAVAPTDPIEREVLGWASQIIGGVPHYYDAAADLWRPLAESVEQLRRRRVAQGILGSPRDTAALNAYERSRGL